MATPDEYRVGVRARAPASAANLGPGFDTLAIALDLYVEVEVEPSERLNVRSEGEGAGLSDDPSHLAARVAIEVAGTERLSITVRSQIPMARGLGSSAALAVAAAAAAGADDPLGVAARMDGHPDNAAASMVGGLVAAARVKGGVQAVRLPLDVNLAFVVIVPDVEPVHVPGPPGAAHRGLPGECRLQSVADGPADRRAGRQPGADPRGHRGPAAPGLPEPALPGRTQLLAGMAEGGALAVCWSGAGPSLLGFCRQPEAQTVQAAAQGALAAAGIAGQVLVLHPDMHGLVVERHDRADVYDFNAG